MALKTSFFVCLFIISGFMFSQDKTFRLNDTTFIQREVDSAYYHAIYIESNHDTKQFSWLTDFSFDEDELKMLTEIHAEVSSKFGQKKKFSTYKLSGEYVPLYLFQGNYYLYAPSDWGNIGQMLITDSSLININMDGPYPEFLESVSRSGNTYTFNTSIFHPSGKLNPDTIKITCIDKNKAVYLLDNGYENEEYRYYLYVSKDKAKNFPMIVNYCETQKEREFQFDKLDVEKLLKEKF